MSTDRTRNAAPKGAILEIAQAYFGVETLQRRHSDSLDFYDVGVGAIEAALNRAWEKGRASARAVAVSGTAARKHKGLIEYGADSITIHIPRERLSINLNGAETPVVRLGVCLPFARKPASLDDMTAYGLYAVYVTETVTMTADEFDGFAANLYAARPWLAGKGGHFMAGRLCLEIHAPGRPLLYIDPSGGNYARYVARLP